MWIVICVLVWIAALMRHVGCRSQFETRPTADQAEQYGAELIAQKDVLSLGLYEAKQKMPWMDSITYEDARQLSARGDLTKNKVAVLFQ